MGCAGCASKYKRINSLSRPNLRVSKYTSTAVPSKEVSTPLVPSTTSSEKVIGIMINLANSLPK